MIYGRDIPPRIVDAYGGQVDLAPTLFGAVGYQLRAKRFRCGLAEREASIYVFHSRQPHRREGLVALFLYFPDTQQKSDTARRARRYSCRGRPGFPRHEAVTVFAMLQCAETLVQRQQTLNYPHGDKR